MNEALYIGEQQSSWRSVIPPELADVPERALQELEHSHIAGIVKAMIDW